MLKAETKVKPKQLGQILKHNNLQKQSGVVRGPSLTHPMYHSSWILTLLPLVRPRSLIFPIFNLSELTFVLFYPRCDQRIRGRESLLFSYLFLDFLISWQPDSQGGDPPLLDDDKLGRSHTQPYYVPSPCKVVRIGARKALKKQIGPQKNRYIAEQHRDRGRTP